MDENWVGLAYLWDRSLGMVALGYLPGGPAGSEGQGINDLGHVAGTSGSINGNEAFLWTPENGMIGLGDLPGGTFNSSAEDINDLDQVTGSGHSTRRREAFFWDPVQGMIGLGDLGGDSYSYGVAINDRSQVVGSSVSPRSYPGLEAFVWSPESGMQPMPDVPVDGYAVNTTDINNLGQIIGSAYTPADGPWMFFWDAQEGYTNLGFFPGNPPGISANGLNDRGEVVGAASTTIPTNWFAWVWDRRNGMRRLLELIDPCVTGEERQVRNVRRINNHGQIAGTRRPNEAVLVTPYLLGDLDGDGDVDLADLIALLHNFGRTGAATYADGDIDGCDGDVDLRDLTTLLSNFGEAYP